MNFDVRWDMIERLVQVCLHAPFCTLERAVAWEDGGRSDCRARSERHTALTERIQHTLMNAYVWLLWGIEGGRGRIDWVYVCAYSGMGRGQKRLERLSEAEECQLREAPLIMPWTRS